MYIPKGSSFENLSQNNIDQVMKHINSVKRELLGGKSPFESLSKKLG